jgi:GT2 family glycosyltransferase
MSLTIVIVNWNGGELLLRCLRSIRASQTSLGVKVIVVDNDSHDGSREAAQREFPEFHLFNSGSNLGFGRANNLARPLVDTPLVLFLNPDTELRPDTLEKAVRCLLDHPDVGALGCKMVYPDGTVQEQGFQWFPSPGTILLEALLGTPAIRRWFRAWLPVINPEENAYVRKLYGGFVLGRKDVIDRAEWFDNRYFMYAEDVDLSRTITDLGWKLFYSAEMEIVHVAGGASQKAPGGFSVLMKSESVNRLIHKYQGRSAATRHRAVVLLGALLKLGVALLLFPAMRLGGAGSAQRVAQGIPKQRNLLCWALGIRQPQVGTSAPRHVVSAVAPTEP